MHLWIRTGWRNVSRKFEAVCPQKRCRYGVGCKPHKSCEYFKILHQLHTFDYSLFERKGKVICCLLLFTINGMGCLHSWSPMCRLNVRHWMLLRFGSTAIHQLLVSYPEEFISCYNLQYSQRKQCSGASSFLLNTHPVFKKKKKTSCVTQPLKKHSGVQVIRSVH